MSNLPRARVGKYRQKSILKRLEAFFLENVGRVATGDQLREVARDPKTGKEPENWHQRVSELRTDYGYTIQSWRNSGELRLSEYMLISTERRSTAGKRVRIKPATWKLVLERAGHSCEWDDNGVRCALKAGETDPIGGGRVKLTPDHQTPHAVNPQSDPDNPAAWQALCGRHQVVKKNFWDHRTGKLNIYAIVQAAPERVKREVYEFLRTYFGD